MSKSVKLKENTAILLNKARAKAIKIDPKMSYHDDDIINLVLKEYLKNE